MSLQNDADRGEWNQAIMTHVNKMTSTVACGIEVILIIAQIYNLICVNSLLMEIKELNGTVTPTNNISINQQQKPVKNANVSEEFSPPCKEVLQIFQK